VPKVAVVGVVSQSTLLLEKFDPFHRAAEGALRRSRIRQYHLQATKDRQTSAKALSPGGGRDGGDRRL